MAEQTQQPVDNASQSQVQPLADVSQPVSVNAGSQYDLMPRVAAVVAPALPGKSAADDAATVVAKRTTTLALNDVEYSVGPAFGASASDWVVQQTDVMAPFGLMGVLNETLAKRLCMMSYWTESPDQAFELTAVQRSIGIDAQALTGKSGEALQGFCPALTDQDLTELAAAAPLLVWYEVTDLTAQAAAAYDRVLRYQMTGSANGDQPGFSLNGQFFHTVSPSRLRFLLIEQTDSADNLYLAFDQDARSQSFALEGHQMKGDAQKGHQAIYRVFGDGWNNELATLIHARKASGAPATDLAVVLTSQASPGGEVAVSMSGDGANPLRDAYACADRDTFRGNPAAGINGICDGAIALSSSPWLANEARLTPLDQAGINRLNETSVIGFTSAVEMLTAASVGGLSRR